MWKVIPKVSLPWWKQFQISMLVCICRHSAVLYPYPDRLGHKQTKQCSVSESQFFPHIKRIFLLAGARRQLSSASILNTDIVICMIKQSTVKVNSPVHVYTRRVKMKRIFFKTAWEFSLMTHAGMNGLCRLNPSTHFANVLVQFPAPVHHTTKGWYPKHSIVSRQGETSLDVRMKDFDHWEIYFSLLNRHYPGVLVPSWFQNIGKRAKARI